MSSTRVFGSSIVRAVHIQPERKARARSDNREGLVGLLLDVSDSGGADGL